MIFHPPVGTSWQDFDLNWYVASGFGVDRVSYIHEAADLNLKTGGDSDLGQPLYAVADGTIAYYHNTSHPNLGLGRHMVLKCDTPEGARYFHYAHCQEITAQVKEVRAGEQIGKLGKSGTTLAHLHFSIFHVDPVNLPNGIDTVPTTINQLQSWFIDPIPFFINYRKDGSSMPEKAVSTVYKGLDLTNIESMKVAVDVWYRVTKGGEELIDKDELARLREQERKGIKIEERLKSVETDHEREILMLKQQHFEDIRTETLSLKSKLEEAEKEVSRLGEELIASKDDWKSRFTSRKWLLALTTAFFDLTVATAILLGATPDPLALGQVLAALHTAVGLFAIPEAITDHQERLATAKR